MIWMQRDAAGAAEWLGLLLLLVGVAVAGWGLVIKATPPAATQASAYNHQLHLAMGLTCDSCHPYSAQHAVAGLPRIDVCMTCHALNRPRGSEAAAGKNPVSHVGKIYNVLTHLLAHKLYAEVPRLREVVVWLCSRIGDPIDRPQMVAVQIHPHPGVSCRDVEESIRRVVWEELARMPVFCEELARGRYPIC